MQCKHKEVRYDGHFAKWCCKCNLQLTPGKRKLTRNNKAGNRGIAGVMQPRNILPFEGVK